MTIPRRIWVAGIAITRNSIGRKSWNDLLERPKVGCKARQPLNLGTERAEVKLSRSGALVPNCTSARSGSGRGVVARRRIENRPERPPDVVGDHPFALVVGMHAVALIQLAMARHAVEQERKQRYA